MSAERPGRADPGEDVTVLRSDAGGSGGASGGWAPRDAGHGDDPPRVLKQRFVLDERLGSGGMGTVFRAKDLRKVEARDRNPFVAVKVLNSDFRTHPEAFIALQREAAKSQALSHRNIVSIYDFDKDGDVPFIIMELLEGQELAALLRAYPTGLPDELAWRIVRCLCAGLEHAHEAGLVHADFKPGNVLVAPDGTAKILDFGIARAVQAGSAGADWIEAPEEAAEPIRLAALTPAYASPEMLQGRLAEPRDDLFSLGVVIYLILTGQHPYGRTPADRAAREGQKPDRPRRLTRRQWRVIERCLAFRRADRPESVAELSRQLFQPSPWRSRTAAVAAAAALATFVLSDWKEEAAVDEARAEARQVTLEDAQVARLATLLEATRFDAAWERAVADEVAGLRALLPAVAAEPGVLAALRERYRAQIAAHIAAQTELDRAAELYLRALAYGPQPDARERLEQALAADVTALLDAPALTESWLQTLETRLAHFVVIAPRSAELALLQLEVADVLEAQLQGELASTHFPAARRALGLLEAYSFAPVALEAVRERLAHAQADREARQRLRVRRDAEAAFRAELAAALDASCLDLDPRAAAELFRRRVSVEPALAAVGRSEIASRVGRCVDQLVAVDHERAQQLAQRTQAQLGRLPRLAVPGGGREDPCAAAYLVGNGVLGSRRGSCADRFRGDDVDAGPRLVVVADADGGAFAITRAEVSWADLRGFCSEGGRCPAVRDAELPVSGVAVTLARDYARWLSDRTGYRYRLPTGAEWARAASGTVDPNRNCRLQLGGVLRGLAPVPASAGQPNPHGLVNMLGNVQEWVEDEQGVRVMGGAFSDPAAVCTVDRMIAHDGTADPATGFRLVREIRSRGAQEAA